VERHDELVVELARRALEEDAAAHDVTSDALIDPVLSGRAVICARAAGIISGQDCAAVVFNLLDEEIRYGAVVDDGGRAGAGDVVSRVEGKLGAILSGERTALNFLQHLSGVASYTARFVERIGSSGTAVLDTRKTVPGLRILEKRAVRHGGGSNHRRDLGEMILVKENHIRVAGGLERVLDTLGAALLGRAEIEVTSLEELQLLRDRRPGRVMLDNFTAGNLQEALAVLGTWEGERPEIEVSGGISLDNISDYAREGVDFISVGALTSSAPALSLSLIVEEVSAS
jgi:nicotinate-nucleotide pyrophosphorylase (carboxylating)